MLLLTKKNIKVIVFLIILILVSLKNNIKYVVFLVAVVDGEVKEKSDTIFFREDQSLEIFPVFFYNDIYYSDLKEIKILNKTIQTKPLKPSMNKVSWSEISPIFKQNGYDNFTNAEDSSYIEPIKYSIKTINITDLLNNYNFGTKYIGVNIHGSITYPLDDNIIQLVKRPNDSYIGYLHELMEAPFVLCPKKIKPNIHQTDFRIGSDCVSFAIYGQRRLGNNIPYVSPLNVYKYLNISNKNCLPKNSSKNSVIVNENSDEINAPKVGSVFHYGEHVAVFYEDRGIIGKLDLDDLLIHSLGQKPHIATLYDNFIKFGEFNIYDWLWID